MSKTQVRKKSNVSETYLELLEKAEPRRQGAPSELALSDIHVADTVFQWRLPDEDVLADTRFVQELVDALEVQEEPRGPFEPLLVVPIGQQFFLVDGHHRLDAYVTFGWEGTVPVEVFPGSLQDAIAEAWKRNAHNKLPNDQSVSFRGRLEDGEGRQALERRMTRHTSVRRSTLTNMRTSLRSSESARASVPGRKREGYAGSGCAERRRLEGSSGARDCSPPCERSEADHRPRATCYGARDG